MDYKSRKEAEAAERKRAARLKRLEKEIGETENAIRDVEERLASDEVGSDPELVMLEYGKKAELEEKLNELYNEWEEVLQ